ncbi:phosphate ABC transporter permease subunit PstC [Paroceanicella profunda]|uniref:Phosphate transport system permease protein n=1 Tax=Paroceanicella profunda TaxID=2579971 RepID=A0A5B8FHF9_9RHOB|nr:phosphate ABC transporter permease subunit PstC [Paroceanicella profunda]QDL91958.1 phosphate ABC transporter permease subunit PstC [Paroceanicella profunda]
MLGNTFLPLLPLAGLIVAAISIAVYVMGRSRAMVVAGGQLSRLHSRPGYHGLYCLMWTLLAGFAVLLVMGTGWSMLIDSSLHDQIRAALPDVSSVEADLILSDARRIAMGTVASGTDALREDIARSYAAADSLRLWVTLLATVAAAAAAAALTWRRIAPEFRARNRSERFLRTVLMICAAIAVLTTVGIVLSLISETLQFFSNIGWRVDKFLFGTNWSPLAGVQEGKLDPDRVGAIPLFVGTLMITGIAMLVAVPVGLFAAIYLSDFAAPKVRAWAKPMLEILAGIPTVVYGFFAAITVAPVIRSAGESIGLNVASESALAAGVVMGIMIIPFISSLSDDVINAVPQSLRDGSYGLGATRAETIRQVVLPAALPGIVSAVLLGVSRAVGETMIVVMAAGQGANLTANPLEAVTTVTVQIVMLITGDTEATVAAGPAFTLGFTLFCITLLLNMIALRIVRKYRELYD